MQTLRRILPFVVFVALLAAGVALVLNRDSILDWWMLRGYEPSDNISALAEDTAMSGYGQRLFYVNKPTLDDKQAFNKNCADVIEEAAVLGCYRGDRQGIHVYEVTDQRLEGIEEVTAVHEMLHQAYDRLSSSERERVKNLLLDFYDNGLNDESVRSKVDLYNDESQDVLANEMHSIFGSEIADLPDELEEYYSQYFDDRSRAIAFRAQSRKAFDDYREQIADFDRQLSDMRSQIDANKAELQDMLAEINGQREELDRYLAEDNTSAYNAAVPGFNDLVSSYNDQLDTTQSLIDQYNNLVQERNNVAVHITELNQALDSRFTPQ